MLRCFAIYLLFFMSQCSAQAPGDTHSRCLEEDNLPPQPRDNWRMLMDSNNYENLLPGNGTGNSPVAAVWNDMSFDGNDAVDTGDPTYWQDGGGGICNVATRVCGFRQGGSLSVQNNWLFTQHISRNSTYNYSMSIQVEIIYKILNCVNRLTQCIEHFFVHYYITNSAQLPSTSGNGFMNRDNYERLARLVHPPPRAISRNETTRTFMLGQSETGFYIAIQDPGSCIQVLGLRVYRFNCPKFQTGLVLYPDAPGPVSGSANINIECVDNADVSGSAEVTCGSDGRWGPENPVCKCHLGYEDRTAECFPCPAEQYRSADDTTCQQCPDNTEIDQVAAPKCECVDGYFRTASERSRVKCTKPPSPPRIPRLTPQQTSISVSWSSPTDNGGRTDLFYQVEHSDPDNLGSYITAASNVRGTTYTVNGLRSFTDYCIRVTAHNGVSDQDPDGTHLRSVQECVTTLTRPPGRVTGVQASYPYVVWNPPEQPNGVITGYRLTFTRGSSRTVTTNTDIPHYRITSANIPGTSGPLSVTVAARNSAGFGSQSEPISIDENCPDPPPPTFCPARIVGLVRYNATLAPASGSVTVTTQCADNARSTSSSLDAQCNSNGSWSGSPRCGCNSGYRIATADDGRQICQAIPTGVCPTPDVCIPLVLCEAMSVDLVRYPNTPAPASGSKTLATQCADNARRVSSSLNVECSSDGSWSGDPECQCNSGYKIDTLNGKVICKKICDSCNSTTTPVIEDPRLITGAYITWDTTCTAAYTTLLFRGKEDVLYSVNVTEDNYKVELADVSMWLKDGGLDEDEEITAMINPRVESNRDKRDTDNSIVFTFKDITPECLDVATNRPAAGTTDSSVDGTAIGISIIVTFLLTAIAVGFLSVVIGLILHTYINKKKQKNVKSSGHWPSHSCEEKPRLG